MPDPIVVQQANAFRAALLRREAAQMQAMTARWLQVERNLTQSITDVLSEIERRQRAGEQFGRYSGVYTRLERYRELLRQVRSELVKFGAYTEAQVNQGIADHVALGVEHSTAALRQAQGPEQSQGPEVAGQFNRLSVPAVENMAAVLQENAPVGQLLRDAWPQAAVRMTEALTNGVALGWNPRKTARAMREGLQAGALQRALMIARTEQLRAYRTATLENYRASGVVTAYKRVASKSVRTCIACLIADGRVYALEESFEEHPNGRCTLVPILVGRPEPTWETGRTWFERQPAATQRQLLGPAAFDAWQAGAVRLEDLVERHEHPVWGGSLRQRSLRSLLGVDEARRWYPGIGSISSPTGRTADYSKRGKDDKPIKITNVAKSQQPFDSETLQPAGTPIGPLLTGVDETGRLATPIKETLAVLDRVHGDGDLKPLPIKKVYMSDGWGDYIEKDGIPKRIGINENIDEHRVRSTLLHEIAHWLDHQQLGLVDPDGVKNEQTPVKRAFWEAVSESSGVKRLNSIYNGTGAVKGVSGRSSIIEDEIIEYWLSPRELWARAYTQYVTLRSDDDKLVVVLNSIRDDQFPIQWDNYDFEDIGRAIDALFLGKGWVK